MKCSLLTLSTFIDDELPPGRRAEVDAHLVGCPRCSAGAATLREEKARVGRLARVQVDEGSAQLMLEQVGIAVEPAARDRPGTPPPAPPMGGGGHPAWQGDGTSATATALRSQPTAAAIEEVPVPDVPPDLQPDLPFDGSRTTDRWYQAAPVANVSASAEVEAVARTAAVAEAEPDRWAETDVQWTEPGVSDSWEADLPPPIDTVADGGVAWADPPVRAAARPVPPAPPTPPAAPPFAARLPTRAPSTSGPAAIWSRARDAVAVRLALSRSDDALDGSIQVGTGTARRPAPTSASVPPPEVVAAAADATRRLDADSAMHASVELNGKRGVGLPPRAIREAEAAAADLEASAAAAEIAERRLDPGPVAEPAAPSPPAHVPGAPSPPAGTWNAFAASSYPADDLASDRPATPARRPLGRHSRAVARERVGVGRRISAALAAAATATGRGVGSAAAAVRGRVGAASKGGPDNRLLAGVAGIGVIFVIVLLVGHISTPPRSTPAAHRSTASSSSAAATTQPQQSTPAKSSAPATVAAPPVSVQTFGSGATGFQVARVRYGQQPSYTRVVFDLTTASGGGGTPRVTVALSDPKTVLVTLTGTSPAASISTPSGTIISSVTLVSGTAQRTQYRITLTRAATATAFFLVSPTRFVLDLH